MLLGMSQAGEHFHLAFTQTDLADRHHALVLLVGPDIKLGREPDQARRIFLRCWRRLGGIFAATYVPTRRHSSRECDQTRNQESLANCAAFDVHNPSPMLTRLENARWGQKSHGACGNIVSQRTMPQRRPAG